MIFDFLCSFSILHAPNAFLSMNLVDFPYMFYVCTCPENYELQQSPLMDFSSMLVHNFSVINEIFSKFSQCDFYAHI